MNILVQRFYHHKLDIFIIEQKQGGLKIPLIVLIVKHLLLLSYTYPADNTFNPKSESFKICSFLFYSLFFVCQFACTGSVCERVTAQRLVCQPANKQVKWRERKRKREKRTGKKISKKNPHFTFSSVGRSLMNPRQKRRRRRRSYELSIQPCSSKLTAFMGDRTEKGENRHLWELA